MTNNVIYARIQSKRDTLSNWEANNPILLDGERVLVDMEGGVREKVGDGVQPFASLPYLDASTVDTIVANAMSKMYPVGSIYMSIEPTNPLNLFGVGEWVQIQDCFLLAAGSSYTAGSTGGEAQHALTISEMPSHNHPASATSAGEHTHQIGTDKDIAYLAGGQLLVSPQRKHRSGIYEWWNKFSWRTHACDYNKQYRWGRRA